MSLQAWDMPAPSDNAPFNPTLDPGMAFANTPTSSNFDFSMQNAQMQRMQNGTMRNGAGSPAAFQNQMYQTTPVVPSKRPHEFTGSPRQASRSQTPQQGPYAGYGAAVNGQTPNPYQHLQHPNSSNASPSPIMQNQQFNPTTMPQRMQTASPSPFSPAAQNFGGHGSPVQSEYGSRVDTPANSAQGFMHGSPYANGIGTGPQSFTPPPGNVMPGFSANGMSGISQNSLTPDQQRAMWEAKQQSMMRQLQANNIAAQQRAQMAGAQMAGVNSMMNNPSQMAAYQAQAMRQQAMRSANSARIDAVMKQPEQFANAVATFLQARGQPFNKQPIIGGTPIHCALIFTIVMKQGGSKKVTSSGAWPQIANALRLHPNAAQELAAYWQQNLIAYEPAFQSHVTPQRQQVSMQQLQAMQDGNVMAGQYPPNKTVNYTPEQMAAINARRQSGGSDFQTPTKGSLQAMDPRQGQLNGISPNSGQPINQQGLYAPHAQALEHAAPKKMPQSVEASSADVKKGPSVPGRPTVKTEQPTEGVKNAWSTKYSKPIGEAFEPCVSPVYDQYTSSSPILGGIPIDSPSLTQAVLEYVEARPDRPNLRDFGTIDLHALTMSLKSGIPGEVRLALDTVSTILWDPAPYSGPAGPGVRDRQGHIHLQSLDQCDEILESLVDCAESQLDLLAEHSPEVSDSLDLSSYEEVFRDCNAEAYSLQDIPEFGSIEYDLDRAAERLLNITTIFRNCCETPYGDANTKVVSDPVFVKLFATVIRYIGTRSMFLRTHRNILDFSKDCLVYLSSVAKEITFSSKDEASCILNFLLSFAPLPIPVVTKSTDLSFAPYHPKRHQQLSLAIQALAKFLASGDPNRRYLKAIFATDLGSSSSSDLLTRAFAMCIAPLPDLSDDISRKLKSRSDFLSQGLLAADNLASLLPPSESNLARLWLASEDGWREKLSRVVDAARLHPPPQVYMPRHPNGQAERGPDYGYDMMASYGYSLLRKISERARDSNHANGNMPVDTTNKSQVRARAVSSANRNQAHSSAPTG